MRGVQRCVLRCRGGKHLVVTEDAEGPGHLRLPGGQIGKSTAHKKKQYLFGIKGAANIVFQSLAIVGCVASSVDTGAAQALRVQRTKLADCLRCSGPDR